MLLLLITVLKVLVFIHVVADVDLEAFVVLPGLPVQQVQPEQRELPDNVVVAVLP